MLKFMRRNTGVIVGCIVVGLLVAVAVGLLRLLSSDESRSGFEAYTYRPGVTAADLTAKDRLRASEALIAMHFASVSLTLDDCRKLVTFAIEVLAHDTTEEGSLNRGMFVRIASDNLTGEVEYCIVAALTGKEGFPTAPLADDRETLSLLTKALSGVDPRYRDCFSSEADSIKIDVSEVVRLYKTRHKQ